MKIERGFTLIELMIALTLGLLIVAASIQVFITANQSLAFQQSSANIQNSGLFGSLFSSRKDEADSATEDSAPQPQAAQPRQQQKAAEDELDIPAFMRRKV